jgi:hypothetical protein
VLRTSVIHDFEKGSASFPSSIDLMPAQQSSKVHATHCEQDQGGMFGRESQQSENKRHNTSFLLSPVLSTVNKKNDAE